MSDYIEAIDIEGVQYDIQDTQTKTQAEANAQDIEQLQKIQGFSVTETNTGEKWIDGKDIYKAVVTGTTPTTHGLIAPFPNVNQIIQLYGALRQEEGGVQQNDIILNFFYSNESKIEVMYSFGLQGFYVYAAGPFVNKRIWFTVLYTKQTP